MLRATSKWVWDDAWGTDVSGNDLEQSGRPVPYGHGRWFHPDQLERVE